VYSKGRGRQSLSDPVAIVLAFCAAWDGPDFDAISDALHTDVRYHNKPVEPVDGKEAVMAYIRNAGPFDSSTWDVINIAANGNIVLTERIDHFVKDGQKIALEVMGVFVIEDGLIRVWRDYFDLALYRAQMT